MRFPLCAHVAMSAVAFTLSFSAPGQSNPYNGTWHATFKLGNGVARDGTVIVDNNGGSWDMNIQSRNDPCVAAEDLRGCMARVVLANRPRPLGLLEPQDFTCCARRV